MSVITTTAGIRRFWRRSVLEPLTVIWRNKQAFAGFLILLFFFLMATVGPEVVPLDMTSHYAERFKPPSWAHPLGTDYAGRDVWALIVHGSRDVLFVAFLAALFTIAIGITIGMLAGLQGSGKTTTAAKLALQLRQAGQRPLLVAADTRRPAAITQLEVLGQQLNITVHSEGDKVPPPRICANAVARARKGAYSVVILDTGGRLHIDEGMMRELEEIVRRVSPSEVLLVADAMTGQDAVRVAAEFDRRVKLTGLILTKVDGDARGGAALSIRAVTGVPIMYLGVGEKADALEPFYPERLASRILGMGDVLTLIERAEAAFDQEQVRKMEQKLRSATYDLEDFLAQMQQLKKMGPLSQILEMLPGFVNVKDQLAEALTEEQMKHVEAIILSMTPDERRNPRIINSSRKRRIARGSGTSVSEVNQLLNQFRQMRRLMKQLGSGRGPAGLLQRFGL